MGTKMKGLFKGLKYIGQIFDEENKDREIQIGLPTDVKHVAHIGWDGPSQAASADANPSWMKEFKSEHAGSQSSTPLDSNGNNTENPEIKWVSEDSRKGNRATDSTRSSRRHSNASDNNNESSTRSRHSRRSHSKDASEGSLKLGLATDESGQPGSPARDPAKKTRRKKSKDTEGGPTRSTRSKDTEGGPTRSTRSKDPKSKTANACGDSDPGAAAPPGS